MSQPWKTLSKRTVLDYGKFLKVEEHAVQLSDGRVIPDWTWVITPDYINVAVITIDQQFICFRQTKYGLDGDSLAIVGGYIEPGEVALDAAVRELREETGYEASRWIFLGEYRVDANRGAGMGYAFLALDARQVTKPYADDLEEQELLLLSRPEVEQALKDGQFKVMAWSNTLALSLLHLQ